MTLYDCLSLFLVYAFLGWCTEVVYAAVTTGKVINRGFLNGPVCPIYGFGMIGVLLLLKPFSENTPVLFFTGMILCSLIELIGGWALKQFFHTRWWDYSKRPLNIGGYVCLGFSIVWGLAVVFVVRLIQPILLDFVELGPEHLPQVLVWVILGLLYALFIADLVLTLITIIGLQKKLEELEKLASGLHEVSDELSERLGKGAIAADARFDEFKADTQERMNSSRQEVREGIEYLEEQKRRLEEAIAAQQKRMQEAAAAGKQRTGAVRERLSEGKEQLQESLAERKQRTGAAFAESRERFSEGKEQLQDAVSETRYHLEFQLKLLEVRIAQARRNELLKSIDASRFGARRLTGAFPALQEALRQRIHGDEAPADETAEDTGTSGK